MQGHEHRFLASDVGADTGDYLLAGCPWLSCGISVPPLAGLVSGISELWWPVSV